MLLPLDDYLRKRDFASTPEPQDGQSTGGLDGEAATYVIHLHDATRRHYDLRLEIDGSLSSWAVPKGPSMARGDQRLAVKVEDHPLSYGQFEGTIPPGNYGAGTVLIWDRGTYRGRQSTTKAETMAEMRLGLREGRCTFIMNGRKLQGEFALVTLKDDPKNWLLIKKDDRFCTNEDVLAFDQSVDTGRRLNEVALQEPARLEGLELPAHRLANPSRKDVARKIAKELATLSADDSGRPARKLPRVRVPKPVRIDSLDGITLDDWLGQRLRRGWTLTWSRKGQEVMIDGGPALASRMRSKAIRHVKEMLPSAVGDVLLQGQLVGLDEAGQEDYEGLLADRCASHLFYAFDLLYADGIDLTTMELARRLQYLQRILPENGSARLEKVLAPEQMRTASRLRLRHCRSSWQQGRSYLHLYVEMDSTGDARPPISKPSKLLWPQSAISKAQLVDYYEQRSSILLPHLHDRPLSLQRFPHGIDAPGFFQKDLTGFLPRPVETIAVYSKSADKIVNYALCQNEYTLLYLVNLGCITMHPWLSRMPALDEPDVCVIDFDPPDEHDFDKVRRCCLTLLRHCAGLSVPTYVKTSGARGLHVYIPLASAQSYEGSRALALALAKRVEEQHPDLATLEKNPSARGGKVYLDCYQNRRGQTLASAYSVRPLPGATVSAPLAVDELEAGALPQDFTLQNMPGRLAKLGDIWAPLLRESGVQVDDILTVVASS